MKVSHVRSIVSQTLHDMGVHTPELERLILGTLVVESNCLKHLYTPGPLGPNEDKFRKHGLMMMDNARLDEIVNDWLKFRILKDKIKDATGVDLANTPFNQLKCIAEQHIGLMVALTYAWYTMHVVDFPDSDLRSLGACYVAHYNEKSTINAFTVAWAEVYAQEE